MVKIVIDAGHGLGTAGKRSPSPDNTREWTYNNKVALATIAKLNQYQDVQILRTDDPTGKIDVPLRIRTDKANTWKADVLVSIHQNANSGVWESHGGSETFTQKGSSKASVDIAKEIHIRVVKAMGMRDRGMKTADFHMTRSSNMPAILTEGLFMDSTTDIVLLRDDSKLKAQGEAIAEGLIAYFNLKPKTVAHVPTPSPKPATSPQPTQPQKETEIRMLKSSSLTLKNVYIKYLEDAVKAGYIQDKWVKLFKDNQLSIDDAFLLDIHIREVKEKK